MIVEAGELLCCPRCRTPFPIVEPTPADRMLQCRQQLGRSTTGRIRRCLASFTAGEARDAAAQRSLWPAGR